MKRRNFLQQSALAGASLIATSGVAANGSVHREPLPAADKPFNLNYGIHDGMFKNHAGADFIEQIKFAHSAGFRSIEDNGMMDRAEDGQKRIGDKLARLGMSMGVFVITSNNRACAKAALTSGASGIFRLSSASISGTSALSTLAS